MAIRHHTRNFTRDCVDRHLLRQPLPTAPIPFCLLCSHPHFQKLVDAAVSSLRLKDKQFMGEVFNRHAKPIGLSAEAFMSALHATHQPTSLPLHSDADAAKKLNQIFQTSHKEHINFKEFCEATKVFCDPGANSSPAMVFKRFAYVMGLSAKALMAALEEVGAPVLLSCEGSSCG